MLQYKTIAFMLVVCALFTQCVSSEKLLLEGKYKAAFNKAKHELERKNPGENEQKILNQAYLLYLEEIESEISEYSNQSIEKELIFAINKRYDVYNLYNSCQEYFYASNKSELNRLLKAISNSEQELYYFYINQADTFQAKFVETENKVDARSSYEFYKKAEKLDLNLEEINEDIENMLHHSLERVYVTIDPFENDLKWEFQRALAKKRGYSIYSLKNSEDTDCHVHIDCMFFHFTDHKIETPSYHTKEIQDGYTTKCDTSGKEIKIPKYRTVDATVYEVKTTRKAQWSIEFHVENISGSCTKSIRSYNVCEDYEIKTTRSTGHPQALPACYSDDIFPDELPDENEIQGDMSNDILRFFERNF